MCDRCWCSDDAPVVTGVKGLRPLRGASLTGVKGLPTAPPGEKGLRGMEVASEGTGAGTDDVVDAAVVVAGAPCAVAGVGVTTLDGAGKLDDDAPYAALSAA